MGLPHACRVSGNMHRHACPTSWLASGRPALPAAPSLACLPAWLPSAPPPPARTAGGTIHWAAGQRAARGATALGECGAAGEGLPWNQGNTCPHLPGPKFARSHTCPPPHSFRLPPATICQWGALASLQLLDLGKNRLGPDLPAEWGSMRGLKALNLVRLPGAWWGTVLSWRACRARCRKLPGQPVAQGRGRARPAPPTHATPYSIHLAEPGWPAG